MAVGGEVMGFTEKKWTAATRLEIGDQILCYLTKVSAFVATLRVTGPAYKDSTPIWSDGVFPVRVPVAIEIERSLTEAVPIRSLKNELSIFKGKREAGWTVYVRSSPRRWTEGDASAVVRSLRDSSQKHITPRKPVEAMRRSAVGANKKIPSSVRVGRVVQKSLRLQQSERSKLVGSNDSVLSGNKVTGYSVNVPIANTCRPTAVCVKTCYFATGASSWANSLRHQWMIYDSIRSDPIKFSERAALEYDRLGLTFLRWNGGGDLFPESVDAVNHLSAVRPDIVLWVVTRIPEMAAAIEDRPNVFVHFSLDKNSRLRRDDFLTLKPKSKNFFFSYQAEEGEEPSLDAIRGVSVVFFNNYKPKSGLNTYESDVICPLNERADIADVCESCRRCFDGTAVKHRRSQSQDT